MPVRPIQDTLRDIRMGSMLNDFSLEFNELDHLFEDYRQSIEAGTEMGVFI